jgi:hypothetical protein
MMGGIGPTIGIAVMQLLPYYTHKMMNMIIEHGLPDYASYSFSTHAVAQGVISDDFDEIYAFSKLGTTLLEEGMGIQRTGVTAQPFMKFLNLPKSYNPAIIAP